MKNWISSLFLASSCFGAQLAPLSSPSESSVSQDLSRYVTVGFSSVVCVPYIANTSIGVRFTKDDSLVGYDGSLNYTTNGFYNNLFAKGFFPFYLTSSTAKNSYYIGPYITIGKDFPKFVWSGGGVETRDGKPELEGGFSFGKNIGGQKISSFWQVTARCVVLEPGIVPYTMGREYGLYEFHSLFSTFRFDWGYAF